MLLSNAGNGGAYNFDKQIKKKKPDWAKFRHFGETLQTSLIFGCFIYILFDKNFNLNLSYFDCSKWRNIEPIIMPSGHTGHN